MVQLGVTYLEEMERKLGFPACGPQHLTEQYLPLELLLIEAASVSSQRGAVVKSRLVLPVPTEKVTRERCSSSSSWESLGANSY